MPTCIPASATDDAGDATFPETRDPSSPEPAEPGLLAEWSATRERLLTSHDPEHLASAALLATEPAERIGLIKRALSSGGHTPVILWVAARICDNTRDQDSCPADELSERLLAIDPLNSETWMRAAVRWLKNGDDARALEAVQRAGAAGRSHIYWAETISMVERAFAVATDQPFPERAIAAIGIAAGNMPRYADHMKMCREQSQASEMWAHACLGYGELAERRNDTIIGESIARGVQILALDHLNDPARLAAVVTRRDQVSQAERDYARTHAGEVDVIVSTPGLLADYLNVLAQRGETAAMHWSRTEAARLRAELPVCAPR